MRGAITEDFALTIEVQRAQGVVSVRVCVDGVRAVDDETAATLVLLALPELAAFGEGRGDWSAVIGEAP